MRRSLLGRPSSCPSRSVELEVSAAARVGFAIVAVLDGRDRSPLRNSDLHLRAAGRGRWLFCEVKGRSQMKTLRLLCRTTAFALILTLGTSLAHAQNFA